MTVTLSFPPPAALALTSLDDPERVQAVVDTGLLDAPVDPVLERLVQHTGRLIGAPTAIVSLIDARRHFIAAESGLTGWPAVSRELPLRYSFCAHGVRSGTPLVIDDARDDERWAAHPATTELGVISYCGVPLCTSAGQTVGMLCVSDGEPRAWSSEAVELLTDLAATVVAHIELRAANRALAAREASLVESERELRMMFGAMRDVVGVLGRDGTYLRIVPTAPDLLYRPAQDVIGRRLHDVMPTEMADRFLGTIHAALDTRCPVEITYELSVQAGQRHFAATVSPLGDDAVLWVARDVTLRAEAEAARRTSEERFRAISGASPVGVFEMDLDGRARYVNPRLCSIWGMPEAVLLGEGWQARVHVDDLGPLLHDWRAVSRAGQEFDRVWRLLLSTTDDPLPTVRWVHGRSAPVRDDAGAVVGIVGTVEDVTERRTVEAATRRLTAILEATPDIVAVATPSGRIDYLNGAGRRLLGIEGGAEAVPAARLTVGQLQPQFAPGGPEFGAVAEALVEGSWRGETALLRCDGRTIPVDQVLLTHRGPDGAVEYLSATLRDITKRKQAEAALRSLAMVDELTQLYNRRGFLALAEQACGTVAAAGQGGALFYIDLDEFKPVNDRFGHAEGDRALTAVADLLRRTFRDSDVVARLGGDEFVAFAPCGSTTIEGAWGTVDRVVARLNALTMAMNASGARPYAIRFSTGIAVLDPARPVPIADLMATADAQLYHCKERGRQARTA